VLLGALQRLADAPEGEIKLERKLQFLNASQLALGHTALCLSGGGALAMHHMGVVRALLEMKMLPRVISGTSGGAIVAGFLAQRTDAELLTEVCVDTISTCLPERWFPPLHEQVANFIAHGVLVKSADFEACAKAYFGMMTFEEGYHRTGRHVNISIASSTRGGQDGASILLNHVTTPNVLIYSAVAASCSLPGIMRAATLMAKDGAGRIVPMDPPGTKYVDGSLRADLPLHRLSQLFHVSQFIVSQVGGRGKQNLDHTTLRIGT
jgi:TAG lipase/steryl ester hydrolase/phospholipase A2/LPA acyltransferase